MADLLTTIRAEIDAHLRELAPLVAEYERLSIAADALDVEGEAAGRAASRSAARPVARRERREGPARAFAKTRMPKAARRARKRESGARHPSAQAILAALEHGSHTVAELVVVTALGAPDIREALRHLRGSGAIIKTDRDGRSAYALPGSGA
jgi:hypothetical protein